MTGKQFIAEHVKPIGSSGIRRVFDLGATLKDPVDLSIGQPDFNVPENIKEAIVRAIREDHNGYTVTRGIPQLRERIAEQLKAGSLPLEEAVSLFEEGIRVANGLEKELSKIERKVEILVNEPDSPQKEPALELFPELSDDEDPD